MAEILRIADLAVSFEGETAVKGINCSVQEGESLAIIGPNGAGKSVLLRAILGMVPHSGTVAWNPKARLGYVPQKIDADRHLPITFRNLLESKARTRNIPHGEIAETETAVGLDRRIMETPVGHLSGGQFQRGLIAFALLGKPNVLLLDEPTASIDISGEEQVYELIHRLQDAFGMTIILVSHDLSFVYRYATKVLAVNRKEVSFGAPKEALTPEALEALYGPHKYYHYFHHAHGHGEQNNGNHDHHDHAGE